MTSQTRLESHREGFVGAEVPMTGPLLRYSDLSLDERVVLGHDIANRIAAGHPPTLDFCSAIFHSWGVMCPHPMDRRAYDGLYRSESDVPFEDCQWYSCAVCDCIVINR